jgi:hypothetical protein
MCHSISKNSTRNEVNNVMNTTITQLTNNITTIVNSTITEVTTNIINTNVSNAKINIAGGNNGKITNIDITGTNNTFDIKQNLTEQANFTACQQLMNNTQDMADLANTVNTSVMSQLSTKSASNDSLKALANLQAGTQQQGGITGVLDSIVNMLPHIVDSLSGKETNTEIVSIVSTIINVNLTTIINNINNISNIIKNQIITNINNNNQTECLAQINKTNNVDISGATIRGSGNKFLYNQSISINTTISCIQSNANTTAMQIALISASTGVAAASIENSMSATHNVSVETTTTAKQTVVPDSFLGLSNCGSCNKCGPYFCPICIILLICMLLSALFAFYRWYSNRQSNS